MGNMEANDLEKFMEKVKRREKMQNYFDIEWRKYKRDRSLKNRVRLWFRNQSYKFLWKIVLSRNMEYSLGKKFYIHVTFVLRRLWANGKSGLIKLDWIWGIEIGKLHMEWNVTEYTVR